MTLPDRILFHLAQHGPATNRQITDALVESPKAVHNATCRLLRLGIIQAEQVVYKGIQMQSAFSAVYVPFENETAIRASLDKLQSAWA